MNIAALLRLLDAVTSCGDSAEFNQPRRGPGTALVAAGARPGTGRGGHLEIFYSLTGRGPLGDMAKDPNSRSGINKPGLLTLTIKDKSALYLAYMPFVQNGGLFIPTSSNLSTRRRGFHAAQFDGRG